MRLLPEEQELKRLQQEQAELEEQVISDDLRLETTKAEIMRFQYRYNQTVGRLYAQLDELDALIAKAKVEQFPGDLFAEAEAADAEQRAKTSAEESGVTEAQLPPYPEITPEIKLAYRKAALLIHPDRASTDSERLRRTSLMAQLNCAYERADQSAIERLTAEYGEDPEAVTGLDVASQLIRAIRRIAQLRRRIGEVLVQMNEIQQTDLYQLKHTIEETEALGGNPLADLAQKLMRDVSEKKDSIGDSTAGALPMSCLMLSHRCSGGGQVVPFSCK